MENYVMENYELVRRCSDYAAIAHLGQFRKDKKTPYIVHPARVVSSIGICDPIVKCEAWMHDVIEDCSILCDSGEKIIRNHNNTFDNFLKSLEDIISSSEIMQMKRQIELLTKKKCLSKTIEEKKKNNTLNYKSIEGDGKDGTVLIKACDRIDNLPTAHSFSQDNFRYYIEDTLTLIGIIGDRLISLNSRIYQQLVSEYQNAKNRYRNLYPKDDI